MKRVKTEWLYKSPQRLAREAQAQQRKSKIAKPKITGRKHTTKAKSSPQSANSGQSTANGRTRSQAAVKQSTTTADAQTLAPRPLRDIVPSRMRARVWVPIVLEALKVMPNFSTAAKRAGISYQAIQQRCNRYPEFKQQCAEAMEQGVQALEAQCWKRASVGWQRPIFQRDKEGNPVQVGEETLYSDRLAEILLRAHAPAKYSPKFQAELSGPGGASLAPIISPTQVQIIIPDNGRDTLPSINVNSSPVQQQSEPKQIEAPARKSESALAAPLPAQASEPEPMTSPPAVETDEQRRARIEFEQIDRRNSEARARIKSEGRADEGQRFYQKPPSTL